MSEIEIVRRSPRSSKYCFDMGSPFDTAKHVGKLENTARDQNGGYGTTRPPVNHCVVATGATGELGLIRFTPFATKHLERGKRDLARQNIALAELVPNLDDALDMHTRHLARLGRLGLLPWYREIKSGTATDIAPTEGLFILQDLLPEGSQIGLQGLHFFELITERTKTYRAWAVLNGEPAYLTDIGASLQYSLIEGEVVLHDIEPMYGPSS